MPSQRVVATSTTRLSVQKSVLWVLGAIPPRLKAMLLRVQKRDATLHRV